MHKAGLNFSDICQSAISGKTNKQAANSFLLIIAQEVDTISRKWTIWYSPFQKKCYKIYLYEAGAFDIFLKLCLWTVDCHFLGPSLCGVILITSHQKVFILFSPSLYLMIQTQELLKTCHLKLQCVIYSVRCRAAAFCNILCRRQGGLCASAAASGGAVNTAHTSALPHCAQGHFETDRENAHGFSVEDREISSKWKQQLF